MWQNAKWNSPPPPLSPHRSRIGPPDEHVRGTKACPSRSGRAWVTAAMFIGQLRWQSGGVGVWERGGSALFRQELGLSSDSKIRLIYDISTAVFPTTPLTLADKRPAGRRWHSAKLFVCLPLIFAAKDRFPSPLQTCAILDNFQHHILQLCAASKATVEIRHDTQTWSGLRRINHVNTHSC